MRWIQGNEIQTKENPALFEWFRARQSRLTTSNNVFYLCDRPTNTSKSIQKETARILVPSSLQQRILTLAHQHPLHGHRGTMATYRSIAQEYAWKGLFSKVAKFCKACESCQARRIPRGCYPALKRPVSDQRRFHTVASDFSRPATGKQRYR